MKTKIAYAAGLLTTSLGALALAGCPENPVVVDANVPDAVIVPQDTPTPPEDQGIRRDTGPTGDTGASCGTRGNLGG